MRFVVSCAVRTLYVSVAGGVALPLVQGDLDRGRAI
jgi:hypothetical protein